jgi:CubicO group peptidase (beta-lactamase class C family)
MPEARDREHPNNSKAVNAARRAGPEAVKDKVYLLLLLVGLAGCATTPPPSLSADMDSLAAAEEFSGTVIVTRGDERLLAQAYGFADRELGVRNRLDTKFRIGSITKQFTSMAVLLLAERGVVRLDDSITRYLRDAPRSWQHIRIHHLLNHTSGLMHSWELPGFAATMMLARTLDDSIQRYYERPLLSPPGTRFHYSGVGYFVLAKVIETVSGETFEAFLQGAIFGPLGMRNTGADRPGRSSEDRAEGYVRDSNGIRRAASIYLPALAGGGNLYSTAPDLALWDQALRRGMLISPASYKAMYTPGLGGYGFGWFVGYRWGRQELSHSGELPGFDCHIIRTPGAQLAIIVLSNVASTRMSARSIAERVRERVP